MEAAGVLVGSRAQDPTGALVLEHVMGRTVVTRTYAKYPLRFMVLANVGRNVDVAWVCLISYGGGMVAGDAVSFTLDVGNGCTGVLTTQASTKIYHATPGRGVNQVLEATVSEGAMLALIPDPVTCFKDARYMQRQTFQLALGGSLVAVDWLTSGRRERGEVWSFESYRSSNCVRRIGGGPPLLLDTVALDSKASISVAQRLHGLHVMAVVLLVGPRTAVVRETAETAANAATRAAFTRARWQGRTAGRDLVTSQQGHAHSHDRRDTLIASVSKVGDQGEGLIVRFACATTEEAYSFLRTALAPLAAQLGEAPYASLG